MGVYARLNSIIQTLFFRAVRFHCMPIPSLHSQVVVKNTALCEEVSVFREYDIFILIYFCKIGKKLLLLNWACIRTGNYFTIDIHYWPNVFFCPIITHVHVVWFVLLQYIIFTTVYWTHPYKYELSGFFFATKDIVTICPFNHRPDSQWRLTFIPRRIQ